LIFCVIKPKTAHIVGLLHGFILKSKSMIKEMDNLNDLTFIRLRSQKDEILIAPDREFTMIVIQKPVTNKR
jgi:dynein light chain roadblock-type